VNIIWFERDAGKIEDLSQRSEELKAKGFSGTMYPYDIDCGDFFTKIAEQKVDKFQYIVAIRPYVISPQYLSMVCKSLNKKYRNRVSINFLTGWIKEYEYNFGGVLTEPNDKSSSVDRSKYMLEYAEEFKSLKTIIPSFYVSTTNDEVFKKCKQNQFPMIVPYVWYKQNRFDLKNTKFIISICPVFDESDEKHQDLEVFSKNDFFRFLDDCKKANVYGVLIHENTPGTQYESIINAISEYKSML